MIQYVDCFVFYIPMADMATDIRHSEAFVFAYVRTKLRHSPCVLVEV